MLWWFLWLLRYLADRSMVYCWRTLLTSCLLLVVLCTSNFALLKENREVQLKNHQHSVRLVETASVHLCRVCTSSLSQILLYSILLKTHPWCCLNRSSIKNVRHFLTLSIGHPSLFLLLLSTLYMFELVIEPIYQRSALCLNRFVIMV